MALLPLVDRPRVDDLERDAGFECISQELGAHYGLIAEHLGLLILISDVRRGRGVVGSRLLGVG